QSSEGGTSLLPRGRRLALVRLPDGFDELGLVHRGPARDVELPGDVHEVALGRVGVDALRRPGRAVASRRATAGSLRIAGALVLLGLPSVADFLVRVLQRGERGTVRALAFAVCLDRGVVRLDPRLLRL